MVTNRAKEGFHVDIHCTAQIARREALIEITLTRGW